jgi:hypothetical protein
LIGTLAVCPDTGEMFTIVTDVVEVMHSQATEFSLEYTSDSWDRISTIIESMQSSPQRRTWRLTGQAHGHNFLPANGAEPCAACQAAEICSRRTDYVSSEDTSWTRAVFANQPFALSHIFGLTARHKRPNPDEVDTLFGMADGRLLSRTFHVIDDFDPSQWEQGGQDNQGDHHGR